MPPFQVQYWCCSNPRQPFWRDDMETEDLSRAATRLTEIRQSGRAARIVDAQGQIYQ